MTPGARISAAIEVLHDIDDGLAAEQALTRWARRSRFAGSKDRAAIRDHVFDVLRCKRVAAHLGGGSNPRALMIGVLRHQGADLGALFDGQGHAPQELTPEEIAVPTPAQDIGTIWNLPDWLCTAFEASLGEKAAQTALALQHRAPVFLRANLAKTTRHAAQQMLAQEGITATENPHAPGALTIVEGARKIRNSQAFSDGYVEPQDAASQAVVAALPAGGRVLDYCAGGGGKALGLAMDTTRRVFAHDIDPRRMTDLPARATRAGAPISLLATADVTAEGPFDVVLCDAPCSGSGAWRRAAQGKWTLTADRLAQLTEIQDEILDRAAALTAPEGTLAYATCSVLRTENEDRIAAFVTRHPGWQATFTKRFDVDDQGDGFFTTHLTRVQT